MAPERGRPSRGNLDVAFPDASGAARDRTGGVTHSDPAPPRRAEEPRPQRSPDVAAAAVIATDGVVTLRAPAAGDAARLVAGRDAEFRRWLGPGSAAPAPYACVWVDDELVGWVDYDTDREHDWLGAGEVNVGYSLLAPARGKGYASRAVELLLRDLADDTSHQ